MKNEKGITLASLIITIIVILIIASISVYTGTSTIKYVRYNKAKSEIQLLQTNVDKWYQEYLDGNDEVLDYGEYIFDSDNNTINPIIGDIILEDTFANAGITSRQNSYRFFSEKDLKDELGLDMSYDFLVSIERRDVILFGGINYNGKTYYTTDDFGIMKVKETPLNELSFQLKQEVGFLKNIIIYDLSFADTNNEDVNISKFRVFISEKGTDKWTDVTNKITETQINNQKAYKISDLEYTEYYVKISTIDNKVDNQEMVAIEEPRAVFLDGQEVNRKMKILAGNSEAIYSSTNTNINAIKRANTMDERYETDKVDVSTSESNTPIYMWFDNESATIYYYTVDPNPEANSDSSYMFYKLNSATTLELETIDTSKVTKMIAMFWENSSLSKLDLSNFDTGNVEDMSHMFARCRGLKSLDLSSFNTRKVKSMLSMFADCYGLITLNLISFDTSNVTTMEQMFQMAQFDDDNPKLERIVFGKKWNTAKVSNMNAMFWGNVSLKELELGNFDTGNVEDMSNMFARCESLNSLDLSSFNTSKVTKMSCMIADCTNLITIYASQDFVTTNVDNSVNMFVNDTNLKGEKETTINNNPIDSTYARIDGGISNPGYFTAKPGA